MNNTYRSQVLPLVKAYNADRDMVKNMVIIMTRVSETDLLPHLLWTPIIIYKKELEEMSEMPDDDYKYVDGDEDGASPNSHKHFFPYMGFCASIWGNVRHHCHHHHHHHHTQKSKSINTEACLIAH